MERRLKFSQLKVSGGSARRLAKRLLSFDMFHPYPKQASRRAMAKYDVEQFELEGR